MRLTYDGSQFHGWQVQDHCESVEARLARAFTTAARCPVRVFGAGRTDAGVHALDQIAHCDLPLNLELERLRGSVNALAAPGVAVKALIPVPDYFHARHSALGKVYRYQIFNRPYPPVLAPQRSWWVRVPLDVEAMRRAARPLLGKHDFSAFRAAACAARNPVRTLARLDIAEQDQPDVTLAIELECNGFLQHMARIIVGTLVATGQGRLAPETTQSILASRDRTMAEITAPPGGLHLVRVLYDADIFPQLAG